MELTKDQEAKVLEMVADKIAERKYNDIMSQLGEFVGPSFGIPVSLAARITGWSTSWIRRNIQLHDAEGQTQLVSIGNIREAWDAREGK